MSACMCTILVFKNAVMLTGNSVKRNWMNFWTIIVPVRYTQAQLPLQLPASVSVVLLVMSQ